MVVVAQLVRASVCGTEGRRFEPGLPPKKQSLINFDKAFLFPKYWKKEKAFALTKALLFIGITILYSALSTTSLSARFAISQAV